MPTQVEIQTTIDTNRSEDGIRALRTGLRDLISLQTQVGRGSSQFDQLQRAISQTEGRIRTLNDGFGTLRGSGVERLTNSIGLLREGLLSADPERLTAGFEGLNSAMKAIPIFLIIEGLKLLYDNFEKIADFFSTSAQNIKFYEESLKDLTKQVEITSEKIDYLLILRTSELKALQLQGAAYSEIIEKTKEINALNQNKLRDQFDLTTRAVANQFIVLENLKSKFKAFESGGIGFLSYIFGINPAASAKEIKDAEDKLNELQAKSADSFNKLKGQQVNSNDQIAELNKQAADAAEQTRRKVAQLRIDDIQQAEQKEVELRTEQHREERYDDQHNAQLLVANQTAYENDIIDIRKKYGAMRAANAADDRNREEQFQKDRDAALLAEEEKANADEINFYLATREAEADIDKDIYDARHKAQLLAYRNADAAEKAQNEYTLDQKISFIELDRDTQLQNEDLTQKQRIDIIQKAEKDILKLKEESAQKIIGIAQDYANQLNTINGLINKNEDYAISQLQYQHDAAQKNNDNRTQEELNAEDAKTKALLANDSLTSDQRAAIQDQSEQRKQNIQTASANAQLQTDQQLAQKTNEIKKKQFERDKALQLVNIAINTAGAIVKTIGELGGVAALTPFGIAAIAGVAAIGVAEAALVASQKFDDSGAAANASVAPISGGSGSGSSIGSSSGSTSPTPTFNPQAIGTTFKTQANETDVQKAVDNRVYVLESDIRNVANKVNVYETRATFGI